jgi:putative transposase
VTDQFLSYGAALRALLPGVTHCQSQYLNNRAENSHQPRREREQVIKHVKSARQAQRFLAACSGISPHSRARRQQPMAAPNRQELAVRVQTWRDVTGLAAVA